MANAKQKMERADQTMKQYTPDLYKNIEKGVQRSWTPAQKQASGQVGKELGRFLPGVFNAVNTGMMGGGGAADASPQARLMSMGGAFGDLLRNIGGAQDYSNQVGASYRDALNKSFGRADQGYGRAQDKYGRAQQQYSMNQQMQQQAEQRAWQAAEAQKARDFQAQQAALAASRRGGGGGGGGGNWWENIPQVSTRMPDITQGQYEQIMGAPGSAAQDFFSRFPGFGGGGGDSSGGGGLGGWLEQAQGMTPQQAQTRQSYEDIRSKLPW